MATIGESFPLSRLRELRDGDRRAREEFFDFFYDRVYHYVAKLVRDDHLAEDLTHEVFLKLHRTLDRLDPDRDPASWVFTVATNTVRDHWRRRSTRDARDAIEIDEAYQSPSTSDSAADEDLVREEDHSRVHLALGQLSESDREILVLRNWAELDVSQIAETLDLRPDAVRQRWSRAVRRLGDAYRAIEAGEAGAP